MNMRAQYFFLFCMMVAVACEPAATSPSSLHTITPPAAADTAYRETLRTKGAEAKLFCTENGFNTGQCFLLHMGRHSGLARFYIWDMETNTATDSALVSHGCGMSSWGVDGTADAPVFSNAFESHCSSLGKYRIGARGWSQWGIHVKYLLHGLDSTNNNALDRQVVLHGWNMMQTQETYPAGSPEGWGCPAVSNVFMEKLDVHLKNSTKPVLLWMFTD